MNHPKNLNKARALVNQNPGYLKHQYELSDLEEEGNLLEKQDKICFS